MAIDDNVIVVGANGTSDATNGTFADGAAYIYAHGVTGWPTSPTTSLADPLATSNDDFGVSVAIDGSNIVVGSDGPPAGPGGGFDQFEGVVYYYTKGASGWPATPGTTVADPGTTSGDYFGDSVAVETGVVLVGGRGCPVGCAQETHPGSAYLFSG